MAASRSNTPVLNIRPLHPKSTFTIEEWDAKAPLGEVETKSIAVIKAANERSPILQLPTARVSLMCLCSISRCLKVQSCCRPRKSILLLFHARQLPNNASNPIQARAPQPRARVHHPLRTRTHFIPNSLSRPLNSFTTGSRSLTAPWRIARRPTSGSTSCVYRNTSTCATG